MGLINMSVALDSNVFIAALSPKENHSPIAQRLVQDIASAKYRAVVSSIVYGEVIGVAKETRSSVLDLPSFFRSLRNLETVSADDNICAAAGRLRQEYGTKLRLADAIHLATALEQKAEVFITNDLTLAKIAKGIIPTKTLANYRDT